MNKRYKIMSLIGTILSIVFVCLCVLISIKFKQGVPLEIILLSIGLFATFGGAALGACISGIYTLKAIEKEKTYKKQEKIAEMQSVILFNSDDIVRMFNTVFNSNNFNSEDVKKELEKFRCNIIKDNDYKKVFNKLSTKQGCMITNNKVEFKNNEFQKIKDFVRLLEEMSNLYQYLLVKKDSKKKEKHYLNLLYQLKQLLKQLEGYKEMKNSSVYFMLNTNSKKVIIHCFHMYITVNDEITNKPTSDLLKTLE
ncbi:MULTISPECIES: hypothetical protein [unclassified Staphylococcus]|uniref:hypothetical protein n=1 Tax=unclassified Staphylococcus TaxID=91994 RepID=UPI0019524215|nr:MULTISPECIES: hypothetical protein [unclassified Staphylococcus]